MAKLELRILSFSERRRLTGWRDHAPISKGDITPPVCAIRSGMGSERVDPDPFLAVATPSASLPEVIVLHHVHEQGGDTSSTPPMKPSISICGWRQARA